MKNTFELVVNGSDDYEIRRSRLDSVLGICEEITMMVTDSKSDIYKSAHLCIDLVYLFVVMHLSMLDMAITTFSMKEYKDNYLRYTQFYELLVSSYIEQAMSNYIRPIVLNYHNHYNSMQETEEIYYELTDIVVHKVVNNKSHKCWKTSEEDLKNDNIFYSFKYSKLHEIEPAFLIGPESPVLCRALRYGMCLKLEEMYSQYYDINSSFVRSKTNCSPI
jgi:hypothetical protein